MLKFIRHALIAIALLVLPGCIVPGYLYESYFNFMNFQIDPTATGSNATIVDLDANETDLLIDGPVDLPVTVAKLDSPDIEKITITVTGSPAQLTTGAPPSLQSGNRRFVIEGSASAVYEEDTPKLIAFAISSGLNVDNDSRTITTVAEDGSFSVEIGADEDVLFAGLTDDETTMSPFLLVKQDPVTGHFVIITTNSNNIDKTGQLTTDASGFYYLTLTETGGTQSFIRRNIDGTEVQLIKSGITDPVNRVSAPTQNAVATLTDGGDLNLILPSSLPSLVHADASHLEIVSLTTLLDSGYDTAQAKLELTTDNSGLFVSESGDNSRMNYVRAQSGLVIPVITSGHYDDVKMALSPDSTDLYVFYLHEGAYVLSLADMSTSGIRSNWANRNTLTEIIRDEILTLEASNNDTVVFSADNSGTTELYYFNATDETVAINDTNLDAAVYTNPIIAADGSVIFACQMGNESASTPNQIVYHRPGTDAPGTLNPLTTFADHSACDDTPGSMVLDNSGFLHIYFKNPDGGLPQHALINTNTL